MPFAANSLKIKARKSKNSEGDERLQIRISGELLPDTDVDWYYLTFRAIIDGNPTSHDPSIFLANTFTATSDLPLLDYSQGYFSKSIIFDNLDLPKPEQNFAIVLDAAAYKSKSWYNISSNNQKGNSISELEKIGIIRQDINKQLAKSVRKLGFMQDSKTDHNRDDDDIRTHELIKPSQFNKRSSDKITNFNPSTDTLEIDTDSFGIDSSATFATAKNKRKLKKLAKKDLDFLYDQKKGGLYFNENGADKGFGDGGITAILKGAPDLTAGHLEFT